MKTLALLIPLSNLSRCFGGVREDVLGGQEHSEQDWERIGGCLKLDRARSPLGGSAGGCSSGSLHNFRIPSRLEIAAQPSASSTTIVRPRAAPNFREAQTRDRQSLH